MHIGFPIREREEDETVTVVENPAGGPNDVGAPETIDNVVALYTAMLGAPITSTTDEGRRVWTWRKRPPRTSV